MFDFFKKYLSRKFLLVVGGAIIDVLIALSVVPAGLKPLLIQLITALAGLFIVVEGIRDYKNTP